MKGINEDEAELLIEEHLRERGWNLTEFALTRKRWREFLDGEEADRVFLMEGRVAAILEAKKPGKDLWAALDQAKAYARSYQRNTGHKIVLVFASDGSTYLRQNHAGPNSHDDPRCLVGGSSLFGGGPREGSLEASDDHYREAVGAFAS
jgi:type I site-specific restriction endonuclease